MLSMRSAGLDPMGRMCLHAGYARAVLTIIVDRSPGRFDLSSFRCVAIISIV